MTETPSGADPCAECGRTKGHSLGCTIHRRESEISQLGRVTSKDLGAETIEQAVRRELEHYVKAWVAPHEYVILRANLLSLVKAARREGRHGRR